jgi:hypothetical protein
MAICQTCCSVNLALDEALRTLLRESSHWPALARHIEGGWVKGEKKLQWSSTEVYLKFRIARQKARYSIWPIWS